MEFADIQHPGQRHGYGKLITEIREEKGMPLEQFAEMLNLRLETLERLEADALPLYQWQFENIKNLRINPLDEYWLNHQIQAYDLDSKIALAKIRRLYNEKKYKEAREHIPAFLKEYGLIDPEPYVSQFVMLIEIAANDKLRHNSTVRRLTEALFLTKPELVHEEKPLVRLNPGEDYYFSRTEISLLSRIAFSLYKMKEYEEAINILEGVFHSMQNSYMPIDEFNHMPASIAHSLSTILGHAGNYERALEVCEFGIEFCRKYNNVDILYKFLSNKGCDYLESKPREEVENIATELIKQSYYGALYVGQYRDAEIIKKDAADRFGIIL